MKGISLDRQTLELLVSDLAPRLIAVLVQFRTDRQTTLGGHCSDQVHDHLAAHQRASPPVLRDMTEHPMLDFVPFVMRPSA